MNTTASIELTNVAVEFPVFNAASMSLKNRVLSAVTGGVIDRQHDGHVVVRGCRTSI
jgi:lipopolysaccharide transport system ATP-binding protein